MAGARPRGFVLLPEIATPYASSDYLTTPSGTIALSAPHACVAAEHAPPRGAPEMPRQLRTPDRTPDIARDQDAQNNPLLTSWSGEPGGSPPFDRIRAFHFPPAVSAAIAAQRAAIRALTSDSAPPTFANTMVPLEKSGLLLTAIERLLELYAGTKSDATLRDVETALAPTISAFRDEITQDPRLFGRIAALYGAHKADTLPPEDSRLLETTYARFRREGAELPPGYQVRLTEVNRALASHSTRFSQNVLLSEQQPALLLRKSQLAGVDAGQCDSMAACAQALGLSNRWVVPNTRSAIESFLPQCADRRLRKRAFVAFTSRCIGGSNDNTQIVNDILRLRTEKARLLGYPSFAHFAIDGQMAGTPQAVLDLLFDLWAPVQARARHELAEIQQAARADGIHGALAPWDCLYYAEQVRNDRYAIADSDVKPYLQLSELTRGLFWIAESLFGLKFLQLPAIPTLDPDVTVYDVTRNGARVGLWYCDPYARSGKKPGAWMSEYRAQHKLYGHNTTPIVATTQNFIRPSADMRCLLSWSDALILFHEFGHGLHGIVSDVTYPSLAGLYSLPFDFLEMPSQLLERWLPTRELLSRFAVHYRTGEPMPQSMIENLLGTTSLHSGIRMAETLANAILDVKIHLMTAGPFDPILLERTVLAEIGATSQIGLRHRLAHFQHIFENRSYPARYYGYTWAAVLAAEVGDAFSRSPGGFYDASLGRRLVADLLRVGNAIAPQETFQRFLGRAATIQALASLRGLR